MPPSECYQPAPRWLNLGPGFADEVRAASFPEQLVRFRNQRWAERIGLGALTDAEWTRHFASFEPLPDNLPRPLALRYHGHQFDTYNAALGDGRGFLFAQMRDAEDGRLLDLGTKGSGRTPYSRGADGKLTLKGGVREVLASEMLEALGVYTSKTLSLIETGEALERSDEPSPTRSSVLVRLSHSHVRIGTFQRLHFLGQAALSERLLAYSVEHYYPELSASPAPAALFLREVTLRSARLCARWLVAGFVHGVLNSDNMTITGESFDYGPYRFLPYYDPGFVAAYFDGAGLYAFSRQPRAVFRNLCRLAEALGSLGEASDLEHALADFTAELARARAECLLERLGLLPVGHDEDQRLASLCWDFLAATRMPYDQFFFDWYAGPASEQRAAAGPAAAHYASAAFANLRRELMSRTPISVAVLGSAYFQRDAPCSLVIDEVERVWSAIRERDDWSEFERKIAHIRELAATRSGQ
ncbi:MAG TPA: YdiU family protein [Polyangiaceae bacterium]|jgi:uncharacterized protein YdiU (UPF0061 family)